MIADTVQEVATSGLCLQELPILLFGKIEIAIDIAAAEAQPQDAVPAVICRCSEQFRFKLLQSISHPFLYFELREAAQAAGVY